MNKSWQLLIAAATAACLLQVPNAFAEEGDIDSRTYLGVLGGYVITDDGSRAPAYQYDDAYSIMLLLGSQKSERINTEFGLAYTVLEGDRAGVSDAHDWQLTLGYDWLWFFDREGWSPFGLVGIGATNEEREPDDHIHLTANAGLGIMKALNEHGTTFRTEARYLYHNDDDVGNDNPGDWRIALGFQTPLTAKPVELPPPPPPPPAPPADSDGDGVVDGVDECPGTLKGVKVDRVGCAVKQTIELKGVNFEFDKAELDANAKRILDAVAETLKGQPSMKVELAGHTDNYGPEDYNQKLSERRMTSARDYLIEKGANGDNMTAVGYGESQPIATNDTPEGREQNRRVEFRILSQ